MLLRSGAARQQLPLRRLLASNACQTSTRCQLPIPLRSTVDTRRPLSTRPDSRLGRRKAFNALAGFDRHLATALDERRPMEDIAFESLQNRPSPGYPSSQAPLRVYDVRPFDVSNPLILPGATAPTPRSRINIYGIPGDIEDMLSVFDACVQVGKLDRAAMVLHRFGKMNVLPPDELVDLHNCYLHERLAQICAQPDLDGAEDIHKWFELQIRSARLPHTTDTIAYMLKASLLTSHGQRLERLVDRYMGMLPQESAMESLYMADVLSAKDLATVAEICPAYNMPEDALLTPINDTADTDLPDELDQYRQPTKSTEEPAVLGTPQKGMGLKMLRQTLSLFSEIPTGYDIASLPRAERREIQSRLERDCVDAAVARWREENQALMKMGLNTSLSSASLSARMYDWHQALEARLVKELELVEASELAPKKSREDMDRCVYGPFLRQSEPGRLAAVTILGCLSAIAMSGSDRGVPLSAILNQLASIVEEDIQAQQRAKSNPGRKASVQRGGARRLMRLAPGQQSPEGSPADDAAVDAAVPGSTDNGRQKARTWPLVIRTQVAAALLSALMETAKITIVREHPETKVLVTQNQAAISHTSQIKKGKKIGIISPNRALIDLMKREPRGDLLARHLPMVVEPEPWTKFEKGGFLESPVQLVRVKKGEKDQQFYTEAAIARGDMDQMLKGLNILGKTAWKINRPVFKVMLEAWNTGDAIAKIPALYPDLPIPPEPETTGDPTKRREWIKAVKVVENMRSGFHSQRCFMNFQLEIARAFRDQTFYFPHNIDFRGRAYPIPSYLNHMGADHCRGLLCFAKGKALGESGLRWLKIHLANVFGYDKASFKQREDFALQHLDDIRDSVKNPLDGQGWWLKAEDPWQCLAACFEIVAALELPDPTQYVSHLPVHQDGTCNGLQHYAALGGDSWGAQQVNLRPGDKPADVYTAVAELVQSEIAKDAKEGLPFAKAVDGKITRKVVKQTVMTNVYGVTFMGARKQVSKQLESLYPTLSQTTGIDILMLSSYIATKIFTALSTMFRGAHDIQRWLGEIGNRVCRSVLPEQIDQLNNDQDAKASKTKKLTAREETNNHFHSTLVWTTPLRMPIVQPYRKHGCRSIQTCIQVIILTSPDRFDPVNPQKQLQAFPPNFIHSLDASHMMLSALECNELGLTFAAVHDSFWTHAADVDAMNEVIRSSFIRIHSEDVIGRLEAEFKARYRGSLYEAKVPRKSPVGNMIAAHRKQKRLSTKEELVVEKKRQELLHSSDPDEVEKGRQMVTPASIFEQMEGTANAELSDDMNTPGLGSISEAQPESTTESDGGEVLDEDEGFANADGMDLRDEAASTGGSVGTELAEDDESNVVKAEKRRIATLERMHSSPGTDFYRKVSKKPARTTSTKYTHFWMPLTFPDLPKKGDFDVRELRTSKYFFH